jgi:hypothetical protein
MPTRFGPQLIGETDKTLNALLRRFLEGTGLTEPLWVTLRLADLLDGTVDAAGLAAAVAHRAHFAPSDAGAFVRELSSRGLLEHGALTPAGRSLITAVQTRIARDTTPIWGDFPADDVDAATRVLDEVLTRARALLGEAACTRDVDVDVVVGLPGRGPARHEAQRCSGCVRSRLTTRRTPPP